MPADTQAPGVRLYHKARRFERRTRQAGRQDGALGRNGLAVRHALLFDFLNYNSGQLDPAYATIAKQACISVRSVARGLVNLKVAGVLNWLRRCVPIVEPCCARGGMVRHHRGLKSRSARPHRG
jgi:hypothetical protein